VKTKKKKKKKNSTQNKANNIYPNGTRPVEREKGVFPKTLSTKKLMTEKK